MTNDELESLLNQATMLKTQLVEARKTVAEKLQRIDELIHSLPDGSHEPTTMPIGTLRNAPKETLDQLVVRTMSLAKRPMSAREIAAVISSVRPTAPYVINSTLSRLKRTGGVQVQGTRGSYLWTAPASH